MGVLVQVIYSFGIEKAGSSSDPLHHITFFQKEFS